MQAIYLFTECATKSCDPPEWLIQASYQSASSRVTETAFLTGHVGKVSKKGGTSFVDLLCFCSVLCLLCFVRVCLYVLCGHLLGRG